ncbi:MAG: helix-turn-helix domain-containing protein [Kiloniellaceae bacterium]
MLFKQAILQRIASGEVTLAFRRWTRPTVKAGGWLRTAAGVLAIERVEAIGPGQITAAEARSAGFDSLAALRQELDRSREGTLYRIAFRLAGADPRVRLRQRRRIGDDELAALRDSLGRFDARSPTGAWTLQALRLVGAREAVTAAEIAAGLGLDKPAVKRWLRQLKELGLTESLASGYRLSPRGRSLLARLSGEKS